MSDRKTDLSQIAILFRACGYRLLSRCVYFLFGICVFYARHQQYEHNKSYAKPTLTKQ